jgi:serine/threonine protein kinase
MTSNALHSPGDIILDRYELVRLLGSGGWGRVYLAKDNLLRRNVAIKQLLPRLSADPAAVSRFLREASVMASVREPHVLTIHDIAEEDGRHYMVMEYADAGTLAQALQLERNLSPYEALNVAIEVCMGLRAIHNKGIVHRDVKPANVMFFSRTDGLPEAKIGDFGIALQRDDERLTPSDNVVGTLIYLSPEQASSFPVITPLSDLYSLGVVLYEMMAGELQEPLFINPIFAKGDTGEVMQQLGMFPDPVRPLLVKALQRKTEDRFQNADEMLQALQRARSRLTVSFATQTFDQDALIQPQSEPKRRFPARLLAVVGVTLVLLAVGAVASLGLVFGSGRTTPEPTPVALAINPTPTDTATATPTATPTATATATPTSTSTSTSLPSPTRMRTPTRTPSPRPSASPSPTPSATVRVAAPTPRGTPELSVMLRGSQEVAYDVGFEVKAGPSDISVTYLEGSYLFGEAITHIGSAFYGLDREADTAQPLPSDLRLVLKYSEALAAAVQETEIPEINARTGDFWFGTFRCGSSIEAYKSPYWFTIKLLDSDQEVASQRFVVVVVHNPTCSGGDQEGDNPTPGPPPIRRD